MSETTDQLIVCKSYAIFWDIENCCIPSMERAANVVQSIKQFIADKYESKVGQRSEPCHFICSCDSRNLDQRHVEALNRYGVDILHVNPKKFPNKVIADSKLMESMQKFVEHHSPKSPIFLITGDIDFAPTIRTAKRRGFDVILLYGQNTSEILKDSATESHSYMEIVNSRETEINANAFTFADFPVSTNPRTTVVRIPSHSTQQPMDTSNTVRQSSPSTIQAINSVDNSGTQPSNAKPLNKADEYDRQKLASIQEITGVERHIALRVLQFCNGDVQLAINSIFAD